MDNPNEKRELGPVVFQKGPQIPLMIGGCVVIGGTLIAVKSAIDTGTIGMYLAAAISGSIGLLLGAVTIWNGFKKLLLHENGVTSGSRTLSFDEIESYTYSERANRTAKVEVSKEKSLLFVPLPIAQKSKIFFTWVSLGEDPPAVADFRRRLTNSITARFKRQMEENGRAAWTKDLAFRKEGLEYLRDKAIPTVVPYADLSAESEKGFPDQQFVIRDKKQDVIIAKLSTYSPNLSSARDLLEEMIPATQDHVGTSDEST